MWPLEHTQGKILTMDDARWTWHYHNSSLLWRVKKLEKVVLLNTYNNIQRLLDQYDRNFWQRIQHLHKARILTPLCSLRTLAPLASLTIETFAAPPIKYHESRNLC